MLSVPACVLMLMTPDIGLWHGSFKRTRSLPSLSNLWATLGTFISSSPPAPCPCSGRPARSSSVPPMGWWKSCHEYPRGSLASQRGSGHTLLLFHCQAFTILLLFWTLRSSCSVWHSGRRICTVPTQGKLWLSVSVHLEKEPNAVLTGNCSGMCRSCAGKEHQRQFSFYVLRTLLISVMIV